jgi:hypothetical protein
MLVGSVGKRRSCLVLGALLLAATQGRAQIAPHQPPIRTGERVATGDVSRYEGLYGSPEFRGIDDEMGRPWPKMRAIRTIATLVGVPGRTDDKGGEGAAVGRVVEFQSSFVSHLLCGERYCLGVVPMPEMVEVLMQGARSWFHRQVEVIGAIEIVTQRTDSAEAFRIWSIQPHEGSVTRRKGKAPSLEQLVSGPEAAAGRTITVSGVFRGANLFEDMPAESGLEPKDWVLQDGAYSIWVTGREPKGSGFRLDPQSRSDCRFRLEVSGRVERRGELVYLRAKQVALIGPQRAAPPER